MSLINQMLRDLEARRSAGERDRVLAGAHAVNADSHRLVRSLGMLVLVLLSATGYLLWERWEPFLLASDPAPAPAASGSPTGAPKPRPVPGAQELRQQSARLSEPVSPPVAVVAARQAADLKADRPPRPAAEPRQEERAVPASAKRKKGVVKEPAATTPPAAEPRRESPGLEAARERVTKRSRPLSGEQRAARAYQRALVALQGGDRATAEARFREVLEAHPDHADAREALAGVLMAQGRWVETEPLLSDGVRRHPRDHRFALLYARVLVQQEDLEGAIRVLEYGASAAAEQPDYLGFLAALYQRAERFGESVVVYRRALKLDPGRGVWWAGMGISLERAGLTDHALKAFARALDSGSLDPAVRDYIAKRSRALREGRKPS